MTQLSKLETEIANGRRDISSDGYSMSLGELTNLYKEGELIIRPAFQRLFRWDIEQKSKLVESILLGIPLPSIFVAQDESGRWEVVDGLQRISTILQLQGLLTGADDKGPLVLEGTKYLPALEGTAWEQTAGATSTLTHAQQLDIKRAKIDVKIIKRGSSTEARFDLFQRLNSYGSSLTAQEMRSASLVSVNPNFQTWLEGLASSSRFADTVALPEKDLQEQYDIELVLRFLVLHRWTDVSQSGLKGLSGLLDTESVALAQKFSDINVEYERVFTETFDVILAHAGRDAFRKWDNSKSTFTRGFLNTAFEVVAMGLGYHVAEGKEYRTDIAEAARELWRKAELTPNFATGVSTEARLARMLPLGRELMAA